MEKTTLKCSKCGVEMKCYMKNMNTDGSGASYFECRCPKCEDDMPIIHVKEGDGKTEWVNESKHETEFKNEEKH